MILRLLGALVLAALLGFGSAWYQVAWSPSMGVAIKNGPWRTDLTAGGSNADIYTRARVALFGLLALNKSETIYYTARGDSAGDAFDAKCSYRIEGHDPDARWWSFTVYGNDSFLVPNPQNKYSVSKNSVVRSTDGTFTVRLSGSAEAQNWIATSPDGFDVTLRLYNPGPTVLADPAGVALPSITKEACAS
jgi:hypothetical protein